MMKFICALTAFASFEVTAGSELPASLENLGYGQATQDWSHEWQHDWNHDHNHESVEQADFREFREFRELRKSATSVVANKRSGGSSGGYGMNKESQKEMLIGGACVSGLVALLVIYHCCFKTWWRVHRIRSQDAARKKEYERKEAEKAKEKLSKENGRPPSPRRNEVGRRDDMNRFAAQNRQEDPYNWVNREIDPPRVSIKRNFALLDRQVSSRKSRRQSVINPSAIHISGVQEEPPMIEEIDLMKADLAPHLKVSHEIVSSKGMQAQFDGLVPDSQVQGMPEEDIEAQNVQPQDQEYLTGVVKEAVDLSALASETKPIEDQ